MDKSEAPRKRTKHATLPPTLAPRGLSRTEAAAYCGIGATTFDRLVRDKLMPRPLAIYGRRLWDRLKLDAAFSAISDADEGPPWRRLGSGGGMRASVRVAVEYPFLAKDRDRHGNVRFYFRRKGQKKVRLPGSPGSGDFQAAYDAAKAGARDRESETVSQPKPGTLRWLCVRYFASTDFTQLDPKTQVVRRRVLEHVCQGPVRPGAKDAFADFPSARLTAKGVKVLRDRKADLPEAGNVRIKALRRLFTWAIEDEAPGVTINPAREVKYLKGQQGGHYSWTTADVEQYERCHPIGTTARLALALLLYTGQRRSDVVLFGKQHTRNGWLKFTQQKNRNRKPVTLELPILPALQEIIAASRTGDLAYLVNDYGKPFTGNGFGNKMRQWCDEAGLPDCTAHGLRKAGAVIAAENGATAHQLMSVFGWLTLKQAEVYTRAAEQKKLAKEAMPLLMRGVQGT
jgi:integrase